MVHVKDIRDFCLEGPVAVSLGKFDGLHRGHRKLIEKVLEQKKRGCKSAIITFDRPPGSFAGGYPGSLLTTNGERHDFMEKNGIDCLVEIAFTPEIMGMEPEAFIQWIVEKLSIAYFAVGEDFRFGCGRRGDPGLLRRLGAELGFAVDVIPKERDGEDVISSTLIRQEIREGNIERANRLLGYPFTIKGEVLHGRKLGRTLGMPTTNLIPQKEKLLPPNGVYVSRTLIGERRYPGVTNIGYKPTVGAETVKGVETYIFGFEGDLYGRTVDVELFHYRRPEMKFESVDALKHQMEQDIAFARGYLVH